MVVRRRHREGVDTAVAPVDITIEQAQEQLMREARPLPMMRLNPEVKDIHDFVYKDFTLENYDPHPHIKAPVAV